MTSASEKPATREVKLMHTELWEEVAALAKAEPRDPTKPTRFPDPVELSQMERRLLARSVFCYMEAMCFGLKQWALSSSRAGGLTNAERTLAAEESYELAVNGQPIVRPAKLRFLANIRFAFYITAHASNASFALDASGQGWQALRRSIGVRSRLTHPKRASDLTVSDVEVRDVLRVFVWFSSQVVLLLLEIADAIEAETAALLARVESIKQGVSRQGGPEEQQ